MYYLSVNYPVCISLTCLLCLCNLCGIYYLTIATVAAGIDGLKRGLPCPAPRPKCNLSATTQEGTYHTNVPVLKLPETLREGIEALSGDAVLTDALGPDFIKWFLLLKEDEIKLLSDCDVNKDHPDMYAKERWLYLDLI